MSTTGSPRKKSFDRRVVAAVDKSKILRIRAGSGAHRLIGIWAVVVEGRIFVRSWTLKREGWLRTFLEEPQGVMEVNGRRHAVRAIHTRSERLKDAVSDAYAEKYDTPASLKYVKGFRSKRRRDATMELVPAR